MNPTQQTVDTIRQRGDLTEALSRMVTSEEVDRRLAEYRAERAAKAARRDAR